MKSEVTRHKNKCLLIPLRYLLAFYFSSKVSCEACFNLLSELKALFSLARRHQKSELGASSVKKWRGDQKKKQNESNQPFIWIFSWTVIYSNCKPKRVGTSHCKSIYEMRGRRDVFFFARWSISHCAASIAHFASSSLRPFSLSLLPSFARVFKRRPSW